MQTDTTYGYLIPIHFILGPTSLLFNLINICVFLIHLLRESTTRGHEFLTYINISSFINTLSHLLLFKEDQRDPNYDKTICKIQAPLMFFSEVSDVFIQNLISFYIFKSRVIFFDEFSRLTRIINLFLIYGIPAIVVSIVYSFDLFGKNGHYCWIKNTYGYSYGTVLYICIWITIIISVCVICYSRRRLKKDYDIRSSLGEAMVKQLISYNTKMLLFPAVFFVSWIFPTMNRVYELFNGYENKVLFGFHYIFKISFGIFISIASVVFDWDWYKNNVFKLKNFSKFFCCCCFKGGKDSIHVLNPDDLTDSFFIGNGNVNETEIPSD